jgi:hypothetical protein
VKFTQGRLIYDAKSVLQHFSKSNMFLYHVSMLWYYFFLQIYFCYWNWNKLIYKGNIRLKVLHNWEKDARLELGKKVSQNVGNNWIENFSRKNGQCNATVQRNKKNIILNSNFFDVLSFQVSIETESFYKMQLKIPLILREKVF